MSLLDIVLLSIALSVDAMVVSFSNGLVFKKRRTVNSLKLAFTVGFFQFLMPIIGFYFAQTVTEYVKPYSHWLVFVIFTGLGIKFIQDAFKEHVLIKHDFSWRYILLVGIATSIDALFAGVSVSFSGIKIFIPAIIIGITTFINSMFGFWSANLIKNLSSKAMQITGGLILILLGCKVVVANFLLFN